MILNEGMDIMLELGHLGEAFNNFDKQNTLKFFNNFKSLQEGRIKKTLHKTLMDKAYAQR